MRTIEWHEKATYLLIALSTLLLAGIPSAGQVAASSEQATFYCSDSDGYLECSQEYYSTAHIVSLGYVYSSDSELFIGQRYKTYHSANWFDIWRGGLFFDTSSLPDDAAITSATLSLYGSANWSHTDFLINVVDGSVLASSLESPDYYDLESQTISGGSFDTSGFSTSDYNDIPLNETGMGWISTTRLSKFGLRSSRDISATAPTTDPSVMRNEFVTIYGSEGGQAYQPKLVVTYTVTPTPPVGGEARPVNKLAILAPWISLAVIVGATSLLVLRPRRAQS